MREKIKIFFYILISFTNICRLNAGTEIKITNGTSLLIPANAQICADDIIVLSGGSYVTQVPDGTCNSAVVSGSGLTIFPVELIAFSGKWTGEEVLLSWTTATEIDNLGFMIMMSSDKENWKEIGFVKGNGNSNSTKQYEYIVSAFGSERIFYRLKQVDINGDSKLSEIIEINIEIYKYELFQNYPNPFNPSTKIKFAIPTPQGAEVGNQLVSLRIYDILGREVSTLVNEEKPPGIYEVEFSANGNRFDTSDKSGFLPSGIYFYKLETAKFLKTKKMILVK